MHSKMEAQIIATLLCFARSWATSYLVMYKIDRRTNVVNYMDVYSLHSNQALQFICNSIQWPFQLSEPFDSHRIFVPEIQTLSGDGTKPKPPDFANAENKNRTNRMPALKIYGKQWHIASDDVPLFALLGLGFHALWCCVIGLTSTSILSIPSVCHHAGRQYIAVVVGLFTTFGSGAIIEIFLILEGCRGQIKQTYWHAWLQNF